MPFNTRLKPSNTNLSGKLTANEPSKSDDQPLMILNNVGFEISTHGLHESNTSTAKESLLTPNPKKLKLGDWLKGARSAKSATKAHDKTASITQPKVLLSNISLNILPYEKISVIGPNGAGKSTLMKLILGLLKPTSGEIKCHPNLKLGYVPQKFSIPAILPLRVEDLLSQTKTCLTANEQRYLYERLSITPLLKKQAIHLSGGETQRVLLARSLMTKPNLLILDEPMQGLDPESERWLYEFIDDLPSFLKCAMVVVSHDLHWVLRGSRRVICLNKHICCEGQPSDLEVSQEFKKLFGHQYEQPYIHKPHDCHHNGPTLR